ncbi:enoyl-CoA hydratase [Microlunatus endophyticus]|uniref:enoyl-CoA hydratase n=1 Tax=Microlunatus endophyticus TaxID=1716077 RepID=A0A917W7E6_9ACTN|nr:enoyl-CoA hydratase-related protein [Microlunatus endophyticus]GGL78673.1 enoyl-CoA hydratase [Microlunatus endophyticus]
MTIRVERPGDHVAEIVMDRPEALNAVDTAQARAIDSACAGLADDHGVRVVILSSAIAKAFCVGADLKERNALSDDELAAQRPVSRRAYNSVLELPIPTIAAVEGFALGGGCELALSCDLIIASDTAVFALPEVGVGVIPGGGGTQLLSRRVGLNRAADLIFTTRRVPADEAYAIGLADRRTTAGTAAQAARELAAEIARKSPVGLRNAKRALREGFDLPIAEALEVEDRAWRDTAFSADRAEGVAAFVEKRQPRWSD